MWLGVIFADEAEDPLLLKSDNAPVSWAKREEEKDLGCLTEEAKTSCNEIVRRTCNYMGLACLRIMVCCWKMIPTTPPLFSCCTANGLSLHRCMVWRDKPSAFPCILWSWFDSRGPAFPELGIWKLPGVSSAPWRVFFSYSSPQLNIGHFKAALYAPAIFLAMLLAVPVPSDVWFECEPTPLLIIHIRL